MKISKNIQTIIISAVVTGLITIFSTLVINYFSSKRYELTYSTQTSIPFQKDSLKVRIFNIDLFNEGNQPIENIKGLIDFNGQEISDYKIKAEPTLVFNDSANINKFTLSLSSLNPSEKVSISFLLNSSFDIKDSTQINFRANGLFATEKTDADPESNFYLKILSVGVLSIILALLLFPFIRKYVFKQLSIEDDFYLQLKETQELANRLTAVEKEHEQLHYGNQNKIFAYLCGINGLIDEMNEYLTAHKQVEYWSEADRYGNMAAMNTDHITKEMRINILLGLLDYAAIKDESRAIVFYNIAKIYKGLNEQGKVDEYIEKAKSIAPQRIDQRLKIDKFMH